MKTWSMVTFVAFLLQWMNIIANRLDIVFVYYLVPSVCNDGIPSYVTVSLQQAVISQPDAQISFISNFDECQGVKPIRRIKEVNYVDTRTFMSARSVAFGQLCLEVLQRQENELWMTAALRFFILEDFMKQLQYREILHIEADNLLFGNLSSVHTLLQAKYLKLTYTPLTVSSHFMTASVMWIPQVDSLSVLNKALWNILSTREGISVFAAKTSSPHAFSSSSPAASDTSSAVSPLDPSLADCNWNNYTGWLRQFPHICCKRGGVMPDEAGMGIKPFAVNEMSMLAYFHHLYPSLSAVLPILPSYYFEEYPDMYSAGGSEVGPATGGAVWDPGSWGQYVGGTASKNGRNKRFIDQSHIVGSFLQFSKKCSAQILCSNFSYSSSFDRNQLLSTATTTATAADDSHDFFQCVTAPFVVCSDDQSYTPLWNLHIHSKHSHLYSSRLCNCTDV